MRGVAVGQETRTAVDATTSPQREEAEQLLKRNQRSQEKIKPGDS